MRLARVLRAATLAAPLSLLDGTTAPSAADLVEVAAADGRFSTLVRALKASGVANRLRGPGPYTVFAPTDAAFAAIPRDDLKAVLGGDRERLRTLVGQHIVQGRRPSNALPAALEPLAGGPLAVAYRRGRIALTTTGTPTGGGADAGREPAAAAAGVVAGDIEADNGLIHVLDAVLVPPALATAAATAHAGAAPAAEPWVVLGRIGGPVAVEIAAGEAGARPARLRAAAALDGPPAPAAEVATTTGARPEPDPAMAEAQAQAESEPAAWLRSAAALPEATPPAADAIVAAADDLLGRHVRAKDGEDAGQVASVVIAKDTGAIESIIVELADGFGLAGGKAVAVPWREARLDAATGALVVDRSRAELEAAGAFGRRRPGRGTLRASPALTPGAARRPTPARGRAP